MAQKKDSGKKGVKVQDLAPKKDAKGGGKFSQSAVNATGANRSSNIANSENSNLSATNKNLD